MQVNTKALAENLREIAKRPSLGTFARGFVETAADCLLALEAENERLADGLVRYRSALNRIRDIVKRLADFVNDTACFTPSDKEGAQSLLREARAATGEDAR